MTQGREKVEELRLPELLDLSASEQLAASFLEKRGAALTVDASGVRRLSTPCVQVLLSAASTWKADNVTLRMVTPSSELTTTLNQLGISPAEMMIEGTTP